nr:Imm26 family immunity protein [uncultured Pseudomonas sp.]
MSALKIFDWNKKIKTKLRNIKSGDIFCFELSGHKYGVGRIMTQNSLGHVAEIFDKVLSSPVVGSLTYERLGDPIILDSYSLFDLKAEGDWRVVAHQVDYQPSSEEGVRFVYGVADNVRFVDIFDNETALIEQGGKYPLYSPMGDEEVKELFGI